MHRRRALLWLLALLLILPGCWDQRELEELNYMVAIGIDKGKKERLAVTFVLARPPSTGSEKERSGGLITVEAPTLAGAIFHLNTVISRTTSLAQTKMIMMSEELVRSEGVPILDEGARNRDVRRSTMLVVTKQPVRKILESLPPGPEGLNDFASVQTSSEPRRSGYLPVRTSLNDFLIRAATAYQEPVAYYAALTEPHEKQGQQGAEKQGSQRRTVPGVSRREGGPSVDFFGTAAFRQTKMVGVLDAEDTRSLLMIQNSFTESTLELVDPSGPDRSVVVRILRGRPTRVKAKVVNGRPEFDIVVTLEGEVIAMPSMVDYTQPGTRERLEAQVAQEIKGQVETFFKRTQEWGSDVGGLGRHIVRKIPTVEAWHKFKWQDQYKDSQIRVTVRMELRRFGVQLSPQAGESRDKNQ